MEAKDRSGVSEQLAAARKELEALISEHPGVAEKLSGMIGLAANEEAIQQFAQGTMMNARHTAQTIWNGANPDDDGMSAIRLGHQAG